jgi:hypothetical protein
VLSVMLSLGAVAFGGVGEFREVGVADHAAEWALGFDHPGGGPAQRHVAVLPVFDVAGSCGGRTRSSTRAGWSSQAYA